MTVNIHSLNDLANIYNQQYSKEVADSIERINTGLKINDTADDTAAAIISTSLRANVSSYGQGIQNASNGYGLIEVSNQAIDFQEELLQKIKTQLQLSQTSDASSTDIIKSNIDDFIQKIDTIASSTTYNDLYTLQASKNDNGLSKESFITLHPSSNIATPLVQSNSEGLGLTALKNLDSADLTFDEINAQLDIVNNAFDLLQDYKNAFASTKESLAINIENLKTIEQGNQNSYNFLTQANIQEETFIFDKYKLLVQNSSFAIAQANTTQEAVLELLTNIPEYEPSKNDRDSSVNSVSSKTEFDAGLNNSTTVNSNSNSSTNTAN